MTPHLAETCSALLDGELDPGAAAIARDHAAACDLCRRELQAVDEARRALRALPEAVPPPGFLERLLDTEDPPRDAPARGGRRTPPEVRSRRSRRLAMAQVGVSVAASVALLLAGPDLTSPPPSHMPLSRVATAHAASVDDLGATPSSRPSDGGAPTTVPGDVDEAAPAVLAGAYRLQRASDGDAGPHLVYADGHRLVSVFHVDGALDWSRLPPGGRPVDVDGRSAWHGWTSAGPAVVVDGGEKVHIVVGDVPASDLLLLAAAVPGAESPSLARRLRRACDRALDDLWAAAP